MWTRLGWLLAAAVVGLDQMSKAWARQALLGRAGEPLWCRWLELRVTTNRGGVLGATAGLSSPLVPTLLAVAGILLSAGLLTWMLRAARVSAGRATVAFALCLGGALGNSLDRLRLGHVTDFLHLRLPELLELGTINVADLAVFAGVALFLPDLLPRINRSVLPAQTTRPRGLLP